MEMMTTSAAASLNEALDAVYRAFAQPAPEEIAGCPCCIATRGVDVLLATPLRELTGQQLWRYVSGAFLTVGDEDDFRYLLPRIFDIAVRDPGNSNDPDIVIGKLSLANRRAWSATEQGVLEEFLDAWFEWALIQDLTKADEGWIGTEAESVLCGAAQAGLPLQRWLIRLNDPIAAPVLTDLKQRFPNQLSPFWDSAPEGSAALLTILDRGRA